MASKPKSVQIPVRLFADMYLLVSELKGFELDAETRALCKKIEAQIETKIDAMARRRAFSEYKTAAGDDREKKRLEYLDKAGIHRDWRTEEVPFLGDI